MIKLCSYSALGLSDDGRYGVVSHRVGEPAISSLAIAGMWIHTKAPQPPSTTPLHFDTFNTPKRLLLHKPKTRGRYRPPAVINFVPNFKIAVTAGKFKPKLLLLFSG